MSMTLLSGCAQMFPASSQEIEPGIYRVSAFGNIFADGKGLHEKVENKAATLCGGTGFTYIDQNGIQIKDQTTYIDGRTQTSHYQALERTIQCKTSQI